MARLFASTIAALSFAALAALAATGCVADAQGEIDDESADEVAAPALEPQAAPKNPCSQFSNSPSPVTCAIERSTFAAALAAGSAPVQACHDYAHDGVHSPDIKFSVCGGVP